MLWIPIEKLKNGRDSFRKAREAHLIHKARTIEPLGINKRDELLLYIVYRKVATPYLVRSYYVISGHHFTSYIFLNIWSY